jgi:GYF domain 2
MLASDQLKKSKAPVLQLSRNPGSSGDKPSGAMALSATRDAKIWFVLLKGQRYGPCTFTALVHVAEIGLVDAETGVWCLGWAEWRIARDVPGLFEQESDDLDEDIEAREEVAEGSEDPNPDKEAAKKAGTAAPPLVHRAGPKPAPPHQSKRVSHGGRVRLVILCILAVIVIVFGAGWAAISLDIIRVELMPPGADLLKQVEGMLART